MITNEEIMDVMRAVLKTDVDEKTFTICVFAFSDF